MYKRVIGLISVAGRVWSGHCRSSSSSLNCAQEAHSGQSGKTGGQPAFETLESRHRRGSSIEEILETAVKTMAGRKKLEGPGVNYFQLPRKRLQSLCKKRGFPANKTNQLMAEFLFSHREDHLPVQTKESKDKVEKDAESSEKRVSNGVTNKRCKTWVEQVGELLPGIPDDSTLTVITPKLSWRDVHILSSLSPIWRQAVQSRQVYNERVRTQSTETLAVINGVHPGRESIIASRKIKARPVHVDHDQDIHFLALYSVRDTYWYELPPIPFRRGIPSACQHVSVDGKVYVLGGVMGYADFSGRVTDYAHFRGSKEVYVLDVAGQGQWKRCAEMNTARLDFGAGVLDGKIYVFGGRSLGERVHGCEVYDPKVNAWSPIKPMPKGRINRKVVTVGEEIFLYGGRFGDDFFNLQSALVLDVYHPLKDEWRQIEPFGKEDWDEVFTAQGKLHVPFPFGIYVYDIYNYTWTLPHLFSDAGPICNFRHGFHAPGQLGRTVALGDKLLHAGLLGRQIGFHACCLFESDGFRSNNEEIRWKKVKCSIFFDSRSSFLCPIQL